jgi:hydrogenase expression/formation protein HypD
MKYIDEYRNPDLAKRLLDEIRAIATQRWVLMDVCGGQTHSLLRHGIETALKDAVELVHGPGCPVCVTSPDVIDLAQELAMRPNCIVASFGDMLRVPGRFKADPSANPLVSGTSLLDARARGANVRMVYSPLDAVQIASENPSCEVVFFAVGFETTAPATALAVLHAEKLGLTNFSLLTSHVRVLPAMRMLAQSPNNRVQAFLAAGHVCTVTGYEDYHEFASRYRMPVVVTGFEPLDLLDGIRRLVHQLEQGSFEVENGYGRSVQPGGNASALAAIDEVYDIATRDWRGLGPIENGGLILKERFSNFDAEHRFELRASAAPKQPQPNQSELPIIATSHPNSALFSDGDADQELCQSAAVLSGQIKPDQCPYFGTDCTPDNPLGAPMVSSEGVCAAYHRYQTPSHST